MLKVKNRLSQLFKWMLGKAGRSVDDNLEFLDQVMWHERGNETEKHGSNALNPEAQANELKVDELKKNQQKANQPKQKL